MEIRDFDKEHRELITSYISNTNNKISGVAFAKFLRMLNELKEDWENHHINYNLNWKNK